MNKVILSDGRAIEYELNIKSVKNINLRVRRDGSVAVSASRRVPIAKIEAFIREKAELILRAKEKYKSMSSKPCGKENSVTLLGRSYPIILKQGKTSRATLCENEVTVTLADINDNQAKARALDRLCLRICEQVIPPMLRDIYNAHFKSRGVECPQIKYRKMKARWGSCNRSEGVVTFNTCLARAPVSCIESVVAHELAHLLHFDHSARFYSVLLSVMPDYKQRKKLLDTTVSTNM